MLRRPLAASAVVAALLAAAPAAFARDASPPPPHEMYAQADVVMTGRVESVGTSTMHVAVGTVLKGEPMSAVDVGPIFMPTCIVVPDGQRQPTRTPVFTAGDRVLVVATADKSGLWLIDSPFRARLKDEADETRTVAFAHEMLRIVALADVDARREAMIPHLSSRDADLLRAASWFQASELDTPEKTRPHAAALAKALDTSTEYGRLAAMRALVGVGSADAFDRLVEISKSHDFYTSRGACEALSCYDRPEAVVAVLAAGHVELLGASPRPEARPPLVQGLASHDVGWRAAAFAGFGARFRRIGADDADLDEVIAALRRETSLDCTRAAAGALSAARSVRGADALVEVVADERSTEDGRAAAYHALWDLGVFRPARGVAELLRSKEKVFERRLDESSQLHLCWLLGAIHTPAARAALERAAAKDAPDTNGDARRTLDSWDARGGR